MIQQESNSKNGQTIIERDQQIRELAQTERDELNEQIEQQRQKVEELQKTLLEEREDHKRVIKNIKNEYKEDIQKKGRITTNCGKAG